MTNYFATICHHSISRARIVAVGETLADAKRAAAREFGDDFLNYVIAVYEGHPADEAFPRPVATRRVGGRRWTAVN